MTLQEAFVKNGPFKFRFMINAYDALFRMLGGPKEISGLLEIGVMEGKSLTMWYDALPNARIYGIDKRRTVAALHCQNERIEFLVADETDSKQLIKCVSEMGELNVIIDDGSHNAKDQLGTFLNLYPFVQPGGVYVCEDCAYNYDAGHTPSGQPTITDLASEVGCYIQVKAVEQAKEESPDFDTSVIDCVYGRRKSSLPKEIIESLVEVTESVMFFPSLVVFCKEKSP